MQLWYAYNSEVFLCTKMDIEMKLYVVYLVLLCFYLSLNDFALDRRSNCSVVGGADGNDVFRTIDIWKGSTDMWIYNREKYSKNLPDYVRRTSAEAWTEIRSDSKLGTLFFFLTVRKAVMSVCGKDYEDLCSLQTNNYSNTPNYSKETVRRVNVDWKDVLRL